MEVTMKLGILVNTDRHLDHLIGITTAAVSKGHEVIIFSMDDGVKLLANPQFCELSKLKGVQMSYCRLGAVRLCVETDGISGEIVEGSQYNSALMNHSADKVIVL